MLNESDDFSCECRNERGKYPFNLTWYKENRRFDNTSFFNLTDVNEKDNGTYKCVAQRYTQEDEKSVEVVVYRKYRAVVLQFKFRVNFGEEYSSKFALVGWPHYTLQ